MKKYLPVSAAPITSFPMHANYLAIIMQNQQGIEWFCGHYINMFLRYKVYPDSGSNDDNRVSYIDYGIAQKSFSPLLEHYFIPRDIVKNDIIDFLVEQISNGCYCIIMLNQYYMSPNTHCYHKVNFAHTTMISGYDLDNRLFTVSDFYNKNRYNTYTVDFDDIKLAYESVDDSFMNKYPIQHYYGTEIILLKPISSTYKFSIKNTVNLLYDYLNGKDSTGRFFNELHLYEPLGEYKFLYGVDVAEKTGELYIEGKLNDLVLTDIYEHKSGMVYRLKYMQSLFPDTELAEFIHSYEEIEQDALILRNQALKLRLIKRSLDPLQSNFIKIAEHEKEILPKLVSKLEKELL